MVIHEPSAREMTPVDLPPEMVAILAALAPLFSGRVWSHAQPLILGAILEPHPNIALGFFSNQERKIVAAQNILPRVRLIVVPLNAGEAADVRKHAAELVRLLPGHVE